MPTIAQFLLGFQGPMSYALVFLILLACGFGVPIPEDITLIAAGILAYYEAANVWGMIAIGLAGVMVGDSAMFLLGRRYGLALTKRRFIARLLPEDRLNQVSRQINKRGNKILFAARFMPGLRAPIFFTAGTLKVPMKVFFIYDGLAALISVPAIVYSVYHFGSHMEKVIEIIKRTQYGIIVLIFAVIAFVVIKHLISRKRKKRLDASLTNTTDAA